MWEKNWSLEKKSGKRSCREEKKNCLENECKNGGILQQLIQERCGSSQHTEEERNRK